MPEGPYRGRAFTMMAARSARQPRYTPGRARDNLEGTGLPTIREIRFVSAVENELHDASKAGDTLLSDERKIRAAGHTWPSIAKMKDSPRKRAKALSSYNAMMTHPNVREALKNVFEGAGFSPMQAAASLIELASGKAKTVTTVERVSDDPKGSYTETRTVEHPPNMAALKQYYDLTHEPPVQRHESVSVNVDVMKDPPMVNVGPRAIGELGPAEQGHVNVFAEPDDASDEEEDEDD